MAEGKEVVYDEVRNIRNAISMERNKSYCRNTTLTSSRINLEQNTIGEQVTSGRTSRAGRICVFVTGSLVGTFLTVLILLSVAMAAWSGIIAENCQEMMNSDFCIKETNSSSETQQTIKELKNLVMDLKSQLDSLNKSLAHPTPITTATTSTTLSQDTKLNHGATPSNPAITPLPTSTSSPISQDMSITLNNVSLFMDCNTTIERTCTIQTSEAQCTTGFGTTYKKPGKHSSENWSNLIRWEYGYELHSRLFIVPDNQTCKIWHIEKRRTKEFIMDMSCVRQTPLIGDQNGMSFILSIDDVYNEVQCLCYIVTLIGITGPRRVETCGLRVTRCRTFSTITSTATLTSAP